MSNNNQAIIMAVGVGAIGTLLAYVGYSMNQNARESKLNDTKEEKSLFGTFNFFDKKEVVSNDELNSNNDTSNNVIEKVPLKTSTFFNFWKTPDNVEDDVLKDAVKASIEK
tara:strand:- start:538 stop:870 length:333 start_codon:yes stop_codon:yes gene_type:complete